MYSCSHIQLLRPSKDNTKMVSVEMLEEYSYAYHDVIYLQYAWANSVEWIKLLLRAVWSMSTMFAIQPTISGQINK